MIAARRSLLPLGLVLVALVVRADAPGPWTIAYGESAIGFEGTQAGATFVGRFTEFEADVRFAPDALASSSADVRIVMESVMTGNGDRDSTLKGDAFFDVDAHPEARYVADAFQEDVGGRFRANGRLTIKDTTRAVPLTFTVEPEGDGWFLEGTARVSRLAFGLGDTEDWRDTEWIGDEIRIDVRVTATDVGEG
jgi:polyisoprenoid-binding protein YceI